jgi:hypothetical protein
MISQNLLVVVTNCHWMFDLTDPADPPNTHLNVFRHNRMMCDVTFDFTSIYEYEMWRSAPYSVDIDILLVCVCVCVFLSPLTVHQIQAHNFKHNNDVEVCKFNVKLMVRIFYVICLICDIRSVLQMPEVIAREQSFCYTYATRSRPVVCPFVWQEVMLLWRGVLVVVDVERVTSFVLEHRLCIDVICT